MKQYSVLIVGLGAVGMLYDYNSDNNQIFSHAKAFSLHPAFRLIGGVDSNVENRNLFETKYLKKSYKNLTEALFAECPDILVISTPTQYHFDIFTQALRQFKPKAILCEKPLAYCIKEAQNMVSLCNENQIKLYVNYMRRSEPSVIEIKRRIESGEIKGPLEGIVWYSKGLIHNGSHFFNLLEYWLNGYRRTFLTHKEILDNQLDYNIHGLMEFELGNITFIAKKSEAFAHYAVELLANNGRLRYEYAGRNIYWHSIMDDINFPGNKSLAIEAECINTEMDIFQYNVVEQLAAALEEKDAHLVKGHEALQTLLHLKTIIGNHE